jgi:hypothetical protein
MNQNTCPGIVNREDHGMDNSQHNLLRILIVALVLLQLGTSDADPVPVHHLEGVTLGFLVLRNMEGQALAYGEMKQVWQGDSSPVMDDLQFRFKDGSFYEEITQFTQHKEFRLVSDQVVQKGPAFKKDRESWIDATTGTIAITTSEKDGKKQATKHMALPADVSNGLLFTLAKNLDPNTGATVSMIAISTQPRLVTLHISPAEERTFRLGPAKYKAQHYVVNVKIPGAAGAIAPLVGKKPPVIHLWVAKSEAPTFLEFEGPLSEDTPVWRIELAAPEPDTPK